MDYSIAHVHLEGKATGVSMKLNAMTVVSAVKEKHV